MTIRWKTVEQYFTVVPFVLFFFIFNFTQFVILENLSILDLAFSGGKGLSIVIYNCQLVMLPMIGYQT